MPVQPSISPSATGREQTFGGCCRKRLSPKEIRSRSRLKEQHRRQEISKFAWICARLEQRRSRITLWQRQWVCQKPISSVRQRFGVPWKSSSECRVQFCPTTQLRSPGCGVGAEQDRSRFGACRKSIEEPLEGCRPRSCGHSHPVRNALRDVATRVSLERGKSTDTAQFHPRERLSAHQVPHRSAAVLTGASQSASASSSIFVSVTEAPAISSEVQ